MSTFYDNITNLYLLKYGYDLKDNKDLEKDVEDLTDPNAKHPDANTIDAEEAARRRLWLHSQVNRAVVSWYRGTYGTGTDKRENDPITEFLSGGIERGGPKPIKAQLVHFCWRKYYAGCIKEVFKKTWLIELQHAKDLGLNEGDDKWPTEVGVRGEVTRQMWKKETEEFKEDVRLVLEAGGFDGEVCQAYTAAEECKARAVERTVSGAAPTPATGEINFASSSVAPGGPAAPEGDTTGPTAPGDQATGGDAEHEHAISPPPWPEDDGDFPQELGGGRALHEPPAVQLALKMAATSPPMLNEGATPALMPNAASTPPPEEQAGGHAVWRREDKHEWSEELRRAYGAMTLGEKWGGDWADCIEAYLEFEAA
ncbi:hypothetical protein DFH07DRAFT_952774 [Mycena maculata]|uniref:Uncharacterized protein n=1 Tax=Mycena maculata TaxID=230809 RepID=A0AAD7JXB1_9AGAR|nr:hypothetical protein DFH07DRAFT_952774 [Mycena maculata]